MLEWLFLTFTDPLIECPGKGHHVLPIVDEEVFVWVHHEIIEGTFALAHKQKVHICQTKNAE